MTLTGWELVKSCKGQLVMEAVMAYTPRDRGCFVCCMDIDDGVHLHRG